MSDLKERKPDGGLADLIEFYEEMGGEDDGEMLVLLLELRAFRRTRDKERERITELEAELARRDAAAGEPAFYIAASDIDNLKRAHAVEAAISKVKRFDEIPVFTAAQPSAKG